MQEENHDLIGYDEIIENSMRTVIYETLKKIEKNGLPGKHYFVISFLTNFPEIEIPKHLKEKYSDEMTIVMQYQYQNLEVSQDRFRISLSFSGKYEKLIIPFKAVTSFADPSMNFGLKFNISYEDIDESEISQASSQDSDLDSEEKDQEGNKKSKKGSISKKDSSKKSTTKSSKKKGKKSKKTDTSKKVVSLDEFRKEKNNDNNKND